MDKKVILTYGNDCFGNYIETEFGKLYVDPLFKDLLPNDKCTLSIIQEDD